jgi:NAD-dependent SIR2 family protein deacetylase
LEVTQLATHHVSHADGLLVIGSSLEVFSAYRFVRMAINQFNLPVAIINQGETRAEREGLPIDLKSDSDCCELLDEVVKRIKA